jgi:hypothetical protein
VLGGLCELVHAPVTSGNGRVGKGAALDSTASNLGHAIAAHALAPP